MISARFADFIHNQMVGCVLRGLEHFENDDGFRRVSVIKDERLREKERYDEIVFFSAQLPPLTENESKFSWQMINLAQAFKNRLPIFACLIRVFLFIRVVPFCIMSSLHSDYAHFSRSLLSNVSDIFSAFQIECSVPVRFNNWHKLISDVKCQVWVCDHWIAFTSICVGFYLQFNE